jgi:uncharacterized membrane protein (UPF0127 family)
MTLLRIIILAIVLGSIFVPVTPAAELFSETAVGILPSGDELLLELAVTPEERRVGYMRRPEVGPGQGMLFLFGSTDYHGIWMKNCKVALDIVWLDKRLRVVEIAGNQQPCVANGPCPSARPSRPARYVLELAAGRAAGTGLKPGTQLVVLSDPPLSERF